MLSTPPWLHLARHVGNFVSKAALGARYTTHYGSGFRHKPLLLVEPSLQIRQSNHFASKRCSPRRWFQHKAPEGSPSPLQSAAKSPVSSTPSPPRNGLLTKDDIPTQSEQRKSDWSITKRLLVNVWPKNDWKTRWIVLFGFGLLVSSKVSVFSLLDETADLMEYLYPIT